MSIELYRPTVRDLWFRRDLLADEATMSYNRARGGINGCLASASSRRIAYWNRRDVIRRARPGQPLLHSEQPRVPLWPHAARPGPACAAFCAAHVALGVALPFLGAALPSLVVGVLVGGMPPAQTLGLSPSMWWRSRRRAWPRPGRAAAGAGPAPTSATPG